MYEKAGPGGVLAGTPYSTRQSGKGAEGVCWGWFLLEPHCARWAVFKKYTGLTILVLPRYRPLRDYLSDSLVRMGRTINIVRSTRNHNLRMEYHRSRKEMGRVKSNPPLGVVFRAVKKPWFRDRFEVEYLPKNVGNSPMYLREFNSEANCASPT